MIHKLKEWGWRYAPAEIAGIVLAIVVAVVVMQLTGNVILMAFIAPWAENIGFYGMIMLGDLRKSHKKHQEEKKTFDQWSILKLGRNLLVEFGPAELLDSFVIRPACLYYFTIALNNVALGIFVGSMIANVTFYIPTIISFELRKKHLK